MFKERIHPNLVSVQNIFFGRMYTSDLILMYRAITGRYIEYPSLFAMTACLGLFHDTTQALGLVGAPTTTALMVGNMAEIYYNDAVRNTVFNLDVEEFQDPELLEGWDGFTDLLWKDIKRMKLTPPKLPTLAFDIPKITIPPEQLDTLSIEDRFVYYIYRGDVEWTEYGLKTISQYTPEMVPLISTFYPDFKRIMELYGEWVGSRIFREEATERAKIITKVVFLSNYRWYALVGDLLSPVDVIFMRSGFQRGLLKVADMIRREAEGIHLVSEKEAYPKAWL